MNNIKPIEANAFGPFQLMLCNEDEVRQLEQDYQNTLNFMDELLDIIINSEEAKKDAEATLYLIKAELLKAKGD